MRARTYFILQKFQIYSCILHEYLFRYMGRTILFLNGGEDVKMSPLARNSLPLSIEAKNQEHAIEILRSTVSQEGGSSLRIDRIEQLNTPPKLTERKKRSVFGMVAFSIFIIAISARLITKLF